MKRDLEKLRAWQRRGKPMKRSGVKKTNPARRKKQFERNFGERAEHIRGMSCIASPDADAPFDSRRVVCNGDVQAAHVIARGMGGCNGDRRSLVPLCAIHHQQQGSIGNMHFDALYGLDMRICAARIAVQFDEQGIP